MVRNALGVGGHQMIPEAIVRFLIQRLRTAARRLRERGEDDDQAWTQEFLTTLCEAARLLYPDTFDVDVRASAIYVDPARAKPDFREWLYRVVWLEYGEDHHIDRVALVAGCEWGTDVDVLEEFKKLLIARATVRLLIYDAREAPDITARLCRHVEAFGGSSPRDTYLIVARDQNGIEWRPTFTEIRVTDSLRAEVIQR